MTEQNYLGEYHKISKLIEEIRRGKRIPLRKFDEQGVSSRTYQRFIKGDADLRLTDLAIIIEILSLSPYEATTKLCALSQTVTYKLNYFDALNKQDYKKCSHIVLEFKKYYETTSHTLGKEEAYFKVISTDLLSNPLTNVKKKEITSLDQIIYQRITNATIYTIYDLDFLCYHIVNNPSKKSFTIFPKILKMICTRQVIDLYSKRTIDQAFVMLLVIGMRMDSFEIINHARLLLTEYYSLGKSWETAVILKIADHIKNNFSDERNRGSNWLNFKESILTGLKTFLPEEDTHLFLIHIRAIEDSIIN